MLPQGLFDGDTGALGAGALSLGLSAVAGLLWFLMQQGAFGVKTLLPGDHAVRTVFGRPIWYHHSPKSLFYIGTLFDVHMVNTKTLVQDPFDVELVVAGEKRRMRVWLETEVLPDEVSVKAAVFALGDAVNSHAKGNKRTQRCEALVRDALTRRAWDQTSWSDLIMSSRGLDDVNELLLSENGTRIKACRITDVAPTEAQVIAAALGGIKLVT